MRRKLLALALLLTSFVALLPGAAAARPLGPTSRTLAAGSVAVAPCGSLTGIVVDFTLSGTTVTAVVLTGIPTTCNGARVSLTVTNGASSIGAGGPVAVVAGAVTVPVSPTPSTSSVTNVRLSIVGP
jgi:hypothetical protein